jgi:hypothetical protein
LEAKNIIFFAPESLTLLAEIYLSLTSFLMSPEGSRNSFRLDQDVPAEKLLPGFNQTSDRCITTYNILSSAFCNTILVR